MTLLTAPAMPSEALPLNAFARSSGGPGGVRFNDKAQVRCELWPGVGFAPSATLLLGLVGGIKFWCDGMEVASGCVRCDLCFDIIIIVV